MRLEITDAVARRGGPPRYALCKSDDAAVTLRPAGKERRAVVFETREDAERFRDAYPAHQLELRTVEPDHNAATLFVRTSRPILTDAAVFKDGEPVHLVRVVDDDTPDKEVIKQ